MIRLPPRSTRVRSSAASDVYKRQPEQGPDRRRSHPDAELAQLALDPDTAPAGVLPGQPADERTDRGIERWPAWATGPAVGPLPAHELAMPSERVAGVTR